MNNLTNAQKDIAMSHETIHSAHKFLLEFLSKFDQAKRGGIHDFIEISLFNMVNAAINKIDAYLLSGHKSVNPNEIMIIIVDAYQKCLDSIKKNLDSMKQVNFM